MDYRKWSGEQTLIHIDGAVVEQVKSFKFLSVHITKELTWSTHPHICEEGTTAPLPPQKRLKRFGMGLQILKKVLQLHH